MEKCQGIWKKMSHKLNRFGTKRKLSQKGFEIDPLMGKNYKDVYLEEKKFLNILMRVCLK